MPIFLRIGGYGFFFCSADGQEPGLAAPGRALRKPWI
jgi:hypothetical protein